MSVIIESGVLTNNGLFERIVGQQVFIISNEVVASFYLDNLKKHCMNKQCDVFLLKDGEQYKTLNSVLNIVEKLIFHAHRRNTTIIALGGGVVCDIAGFVAATYQRGVNLIFIPTTLLAQVDAAIGGKNAVNHPLAKNMIGTFYQPQSVWMDPDVLQTLPDQHFYTALSEVIKYGLVYDANFFVWLETYWPRILEKDASVLQTMIQYCVDIKLTIVSQDEKDYGLRQILNFGHTLAHALEQVSDYSLLHGDAVARGILWALQLSERHCGLDKTVRARVQRLLDACPCQWVSQAFDLHDPAIFEAMTRDKKHGDDFTLILLDQLGCAKRVKFQQLVTEIF